MGWLSPLPALAWDATGHRLVAELAYRQLRPEVRQQVDVLLCSLGEQGTPRSRFLYAAVWPDRLYDRQTRLKKHAEWHFIDWPVLGPRLPLSAMQHTTLPEVHHIVWALQRCQQQLSDRRLSRKQRAIALRFFVHLVGDIHQPLHCATRYSWRYQAGDRGGNAVPLKPGRRGLNLHQYWDRGAGLFRATAEQTQGLSRVHYPLRQHDLYAVASQLQRRYPIDTFLPQAQYQDPVIWALESWQIAEHFVYNLPRSVAMGVPLAYRKQARNIVAERIVLAGHRLAVALNKIINTTRLGPN